MKVLVVVREFGDYPKGHVIKDEEEQAKVKETHEHHVVHAEHPDE